MFQLICTMRRRPDNVTYIFSAVKDSDEQLQQFGYIREGITIQILLHYKKNDTSQNGGYLQRKD